LAWFEVPNLEEQRARDRQLDRDDRLVVLNGNVAHADLVALLVAEVDDTESIALGVGQDDEVGILGIPIPVDALGAERYQAFHLVCLLRRRGDVQVEMDPWIIRRSGLTR